MLKMNVESTIGSQVRLITLLSVKRISIMKNEGAQLEDILEDVSRNSKMWLARPGANHYDERIRRELYNMLGDGILKKNGAKYTHWNGFLYNEEKGDCELKKVSEIVANRLCLQINWGINEMLLEPEDKLSMIAEGSEEFDFSFAGNNRDSTGKLNVQNILTDRDLYELIKLSVEFDFDV